MSTGIAKETKVDRRRKGNHDWRQEPNALYRMWDGDGSLLYVGISLDLQRRLHEHKVLKSFWREIATITLEWHPNRDAALAAERRSATEENPKYGCTPADWSEYGRRGGAKSKKLVDTGAIDKSAAKSQRPKKPKFSPTKGRGLNRDAFSADCSDKTVGDLHRELLNRL